MHRQEVYEHIKAETTTSIEPLERRKDSDPAIERVYARMRIAITLACAALVAGALFAHGLHALIGSLLAALGSATAAPPR